MDSNYNNSYGGQQQQHRSRSELLSSAKVLSDAAQSAFNHDYDRVDRNEAADAAGDILDAAGGGLGDKGIGRLVDKGADYLHQYDSSAAGTGSDGRTGRGYGNNNDHRSESGYGGGRSESGYGRSDGDDHRSGGGCGGDGLSSGGYGDGGRSGVGLAVMEGVLVVVMVVITIVRVVSMVI
ncbi:glycine-rich cell wall structural protein 1.8 [Spatholobus suberectus]|nr:glycine-rich cell wall structural protein 1.8 [Spatholobus suberectus]